ncbi:MAG: arginine--tRNA ligase [Endomicrobia bacterium]|nr:arginine--tRNA ligase [Endomicrobiia bacterium]
MKKKLRKIFELIAHSLRYEINNFEINEPPLNINFEFSSNILLLISKKYNISIKIVFESFKEIMVSNYSLVFQNIYLAEPGFLNFNLTRNFYFEEIKNILVSESFENDIYKGKKVLVEFVSANPTGPLHIGHGRCAVLGDVLSNILKQLGCEVQKEYYINDRGKQIDILTASVILTLADLFKAEIENNVYLWAKEITEISMYKGDYIKEVSKDIYLKFKNIKFEDIDELKKIVIEIIMENIKNSLSKARVFFDNYLSEKNLYQSDEFQYVKQFLEDNDLVEYKDNATWLKVKGLGDDKDRVIVKSDGEPTYFFSDIIYHYNKIKRSYSWLINIWGTDHHGYVQRLKSIVEIMSKKFKKEVTLDIVLYQLVSLIKDGHKISMSTREGKFITLDEVIDEVGVDVTRFFLLMKTPNTHLDFDLELAKEHSLKNPVYYIQYAYTRCEGILREIKKIVKEELKIQEYFGAFNNYILGLSTNSIEIKLIKMLSIYTDILEECIKILSPHHLCNYLIELSKVYHKFYEEVRIIEQNNINYPRLLLVLSTKKIIKNALDLLNITSPEKM